MNELIKSNSTIQEKINNHEKYVEDRIAALHEEPDNIATELENSSKEQKLIRISVFVIGDLVLLFGLASTIQLLLN